MTTKFILLCLFSVLSVSPVFARPTIDQGITKQKARNIVRLTYRAALFREVDAASLESHSQMLVQYQSSGLEELARIVGDSAEFQNIYGQYQPREIVRHFYVVLLKREPDQEGMKNWVFTLKHEGGRATLHGFLLSDEFYNLHIGRD